MGLQSEGPPDAADRVVAQPAALGHGPGAPMGRVPGRGLQRQRNHTLHVVIGNRSRPSAARFVRQSVQPPFQESGTPFPHRLIGHSQVGAHRGIAAAFGTAQNHSGPQRQSLRRFRTPTVPRFHAPRHPKLAAALVVRLPWSSSSGLLTRRVLNFSYTTLGAVVPYPNPSPAGKRAKTRSKRASPSPSGRGLG